MFSQKRERARSNQPAPLSAIDTIPVAMTIAKMLGDRSRALRAGRVGGVASASASRPLEAEELPQQTEIDGEASQACQRRRPDDRGVAAHPNIHRRGQQPELKDDHQVDAAKDDRLLRVAEA